MSSRRTNLAGLRLVSEVHHERSSELDLTADRLQVHLPLLLAGVAGAVDAIGLLSFKLFTAHVTGNLVLIANQMVNEGLPKVDEIISVPVFAVAVGSVWLIAKLSRLRGTKLLRLLLVIHFLLLTVVWIISVLSHPAANPAGARAGAAAMTAVSAMACQYTLLQLGIPGAPSTAVMTGNLTKTILSFFELLSPGIPVAEVDGERPTKSFELVSSFFVGCLSGAVANFWIRDWAWLLPVALSGVALAMTVNCSRQPHRESVVEERYDHALRRRPAGRN